MPQQEWRDEAHRVDETYQARQSSDPVREGRAKTAYDVKDVHDRLNGFSDDELKTIPILPEGTQLQQGATYIDLRGDRKEFTATADMSAGPDMAIVPKDAVDYQLWNRLIGVTNPERTGQADDL